MQRKQELKHTCRKVHARFPFVLGIKQVKTIVKKVLTKEKQNCSLCARRRTKTRLTFCHLSFHFFTSSCSSSSVSWLSDTKVHLHEPLCAGEKLRPASTCPSFDSKYGDAASACIAPAPLTQLETGRDSPEIDFSRGTFRQTERRMYGSSFLPEKLQIIKLKINIYSLTESKL